MPQTLYVHVPWCVSKCPYCDFNSHAVKGEIPARRYLAAALADLDFELAERPATTPLIAVFFGGGTPSLLAPDIIAGLLEGIKKRLAVVADLEVTLEANPGTIERGRFAEYAAAGVNRVSLGVQSLDDAMLRVLGRIHDSREVVAAVEELHAASINNFNLDLMYALPGQGVQGAAADLAGVMAWDPPHLSWYRLTLEPGTAFSRRPPPALPKEQEIIQIETLGRGLLAAAGYTRYEISAYAKPGFSCRHNLNYWGYGDYLGIGPGAHGKRTSGGRVIRTERGHSPRRWLRLAGQSEAVSVREVAPQEQVFEYLLGALRLTSGFRWRDFERLVGGDAWVLFSRLEQAEREGLVVCTEAEVRPTERGHDLLDELLLRFLPA